MEYQRSDFCFWRFASVRFRLTVVSCVLPRQRRNAAKSLDFWSSCSWLWISVSSRHSYLSYGESYIFQATQEIKVNTWQIRNGSSDQYKIDYIFLTIVDIYKGRSEVYPGSRVPLAITGTIVQHLVQFMVFTPAFELIDPKRRKMPPLPSRYLRFSSSVAICLKAQKMHTSYKALFRDLAICWSCR